jgi:parallel beta-helix repeat protein
MKNSNLTLIVALLIGTVGLSQTAWAQQIFTVSPSGGDDTAAIQATFNAAVAAGPGSVVELSSGQFYTNEIYVADFNGSFIGYGQDHTTVDVLRGLYPNGPGVGEPFAGATAVLFRFIDSTVTVSDLTIDITPEHPAEPFQLLPGFILTTATGISFEGSQTESSVERVTVRGHLGGLEGSNVFVGIGAFGDWPAFAPSLSARLSVSGSTLEHIAYAINAWGLTDSEVRITGNRFNDCPTAIILEDAINSDFEIARNRIHRPYSGGIVVLQGAFIPTIPAESQYRISHNKIEENAWAADGIVLVDIVRLDTGVKALSAVVFQNSINMDTPFFGGIYAEAVADGELLNNIVSGNMDYGIGLFDSVPNFVLLGNNVQNVTSSAPIYLGPGTSNTTVVGGSNQTNVVDLGLNNYLTGVNIVPGVNLGEVVSEAMQEKCALISAITGFDRCAAPRGRPGRRR